MKMKFFVLLILALASKQRETVPEEGTSCGEFGEINAEKSIAVKIEEDEYIKVNERGSSRYVGVFYDKRYSKWRAQRQSKNENKKLYNGSYDNEESAAHASDTLARKLMKNGEKGHKLNFPSDETEMFKRRVSSEYIGVSFKKTDSKWKAQRWSKNENTMIHKGSYDTAKEAAHASDTLARKLMENGEQDHKLNFPDDQTEVCAEVKRNSSEYIGVSFNKNGLNWRAHRRSKTVSKMVYNGYFDNEEAAAHASDTLARKLMKNGEQGHKLNFPDDETEVNPKHKKKRKRPKDLGNLQDN